MLYIGQFIPWEELKNFLLLSLGRKINAANFLCNHICVKSDDFTENCGVMIAKD